MKVAITGATGFIGKLLVTKHINLGDDVHVLSRKIEKKKGFTNNVKFHIGDLSNFDTLTKFLENTDILYHCAAEIKDENKMYLSNVVGTENLLNAAKGNVKHWVQLSSTGVYGPIYSGNINENQVYNPINKYEKTKLQSDLLVIKAAENKHFTYTIMRPTNVFGFQMTNKSLFQLIKTIDKGLYFFVGEKGASANYVPVNNVIEALYLAATCIKAKNNIYIISSWCTIEDFIINISIELKKKIPKFRISSSFVKFIASITAFIPKNPLTVARVNALSNRTIYQTNKIESELGYKTVTTIESTIIELVQFYQKNK